MNQQQKQSPYLSVDERILYLHEHGYFDKASIADEHLQRLENINFHYFLGYARNYRMLASKTNLVLEKNAQDVFDLMDLDHQVSDFIFSSMRFAEQRLRSAFVKHYCELGLSPVDSYFSVDSYTDSSLEDTSEKLVRNLQDQVLRYREPYVVAHLKGRAAELGVGKVPRRGNESICASQVLHGLPIWSVIDAFQLGSLSRMITTCKSPETANKELWKHVAEELEIPAAIFQTNLTSLSTTRNEVAHFNRLWMKPTTDTPKKLKYFQKALRDAHPKSRRVSFYNVALFQGKERRDGFVEKIETLCARHSLYFEGVNNPLLEA